VADLFFELNVDGHAGGRIGLSKHCATDIAQCISKDPAKYSGRIAGRRY
jgi:hypothetical protein